MSSEEKVEATSQPEEQSASEEKPAADETKSDSAGGEASEQATAAASAEQGKEGATEEEPDDEEPNDGVQCSSNEHHWCQTLGAVTSIALLVYSDRVQLIVYMLLIVSQQHCWSNHKMHS